MQHSRAAIDPLWQCLCPAWTQSSRSRASYILCRPKRPTRPQCLQQRAPAALSKLTLSRSYNRSANQARLDAAALHNENTATFNPLLEHTRVRPYRFRRRRLEDEDEAIINYEQEDTPFLYGRLRAAAVRGHTRLCRAIAEYLVRERRERPSLQLYNALILSNVHHEHGAAWRVSELLEEMRAEGLQPDGGTCHAVLKVAAVHVDHLLRADVLEYMRRRWFPLSEEGAHDVAAGLLREGLFEQALRQLDGMHGRMSIDSWLWDMAVYTLCDAGEVDEAFRIMRMRFDAGESNMSRSVWAYLLDKGSEARHHEATSLVWMSQVNQGYITPPSGTCLNVLSTAAHAGDAAMGTEVFAHLSKRGTPYQPIHYELLMSAYLSADPPDLKRAISILTIMPLEKLEPTIAETRDLYLYLRDKPAQVKESLSHLRELHDQNRTIPIALLNLLIECHVEQRNLAEAMKIYKLIHTFVPMGQGAQKSYANIETFNLLLKGCRLSEPPDEQQASFLVSELLALRIIPTALTYDRLILVFVEAGKAALQRASQGEDPRVAEAEQAKGTELLDWAFRHFADMQPLGWMPRFGTLEFLAVQLARARDARCWDVLQAAEDQGQAIEGFAEKGKWARRNVEEAFAEAGEMGEGNAGFGSCEAVTADVAA